MLWVLNLSDGRNSLLDIAEKANLHFDLLENAAGALLQHGLLTELPETTL
jgi:aminopeptidase-like protein